MKCIFRHGGIACLFIFAILRWSSTAIVLPSSYGYSGDFWVSQYGQRLDAFNSLTTAAFIIAGIAVLLSFLPIWQPQGHVSPASGKP